MAHSSLGPLWPICQGTEKAANPVWVLGQAETLRQVQAAVRAAPPLGPHEPQDLMSLEVSVTERKAVWNL